MSEPSDEEVAREIARWHGSKMVFRRDGVTHTVASAKGFGRFAGASDDYSRAHWREYIQAAQAVKRMLLPPKEDDHQPPETDGRQ